MAVRRVPIDEFKRVAVQDVPEGDPGHHWLYKAVHRVVVTPDEQPFPTWSWKPEADVYAAMGFFEAALYFMECFLGWSHRGLGLLRFFEHPHHHDLGRRPLMGLLNELWNRPEHLDLLAAWVWKEGEMDLWNDLIARDVVPPSQMPVGPKLGWFEEFVRRNARRPDEQGHDPYFGGGNPLHLSASLGILKQEGTGELFLCSRTTREARLRCTVLCGWYRELVRTCADIGALGWTVDVVVPRWGWVGRFRRSAVTGLWYAGSHEEHLLGNAVAPRHAEPYELAPELLRTTTEVACTFMRKSGVRPATGEEPAFRYRPGEIRRNEKGEKRTILGCGFDRDGDAVYVVSRHESGSVDRKHAQRAHQGYGPLLDWDTSVVQALEPLPKEL